MQLSIIIVSYNTREMTRNCLRSIQDAKIQLAYEIILVDNASSDGSAEMVQAEFPEVRLIVNDTNNMFAKANNQAMAFAQGKYFMLLNSDTLVKPGNFEKLYEFLDAGQPRIGCVGPLILNQDRSVQNDGWALPSVRDALSSVFSILIKWLPSGVLRKMVPPGHDLVKVPGEDAEVGWLIGCCLMFPAQRIREIGGLDETFKFYSEDVDFCCQLKKRGYETWLCYGAEIVHLGGGSTKDPVWSNEMFMRGKALYFNKHFTKRERVFVLNLYVGYSFLKGLISRASKQKSPFDLYAYYRALKRKVYEVGREA